MNNDAQNPTKRHGSCHCGDVQYEVMVDAAHASRCNCTVCIKYGTSGSIVKPDAFTLLVDESKLASFSRMPEVANRFFCARCHTFVFSRGNIPEVGGAFVGVNLNTIDDFDPSDATYIYWDGRNNNWEAGPRPNPWPVKAPAPAQA